MSTMLLTAQFQYPDIYSTRDMGQLLASGQTDRQTNILIAIHCTPNGGEVKIIK